MTTPSEKPIVLEDRFRLVVEQVLYEAKDAAAKRDDLDREIAGETAKDKTDEAEQERLERELEQIRQRRAGRAAWLAERLSMRRAAATEADRLEQDGRRALTLVEQMGNGQQGAAPSDEHAGEGSAPPLGVVPAQAVDEPHQGWATVTRLDGQAPGGQP